MDMNAAFVFMRVADAGGFTAAARFLAMPKATVSKKVGDLERELGVRLFNRTTRKLSLTEAGERVLGHCRQAVQHMQMAEREAQALQQEPAGMLTIAAPPAIAFSALLPAITAFMARYPAMQVTLLSSNDHGDLTEGRADVMIWAAMDMPKGHAVRLVAHIPVGIFASQAYLTTEGMPQAPDDLVHHRVVGFTQAMQGRRFVWHLEAHNARADVAPIHLPRFASNDAVAVLAGVIAGYGIGGLPLAYVASVPEGRELVRVLPDWFAAPIRLSALFRDGAHSSLKIRLFLDFISEWFRNIGPL